MQHLQPDALDRFLSECALISERGRTRTPDLYAAFNDWSAERAVAWRSWATISNEMQALGFQKVKYCGRMTFKGVVLHGDPQAERWTCQPYITRAGKPRQPVRTGRRGWNPGQDEWDALRAEIAALRASQAALIDELRAGGAVKRTKQTGGSQDAGTQLFLSGLEPCPADQPGLGL